MPDYTTLVFPDRDPSDKSAVVMNFASKLNKTVPPVDRVDSEKLVLATVTTDPVSVFQPDDLRSNGGLIIQGDVVDNNGHIISSIPSSAVLTILEGGTANNRYWLRFHVTTSWGNEYTRSGLIQVKNL